MFQNPSFSILVAAVVRRPFRQAQGPELVEGLTGRFDKLKAGGVTTAATTKPKSFGFAHGHRQGSGNRIYGE